jgi:hypothetical protein
VTRPADGPAKRRPGPSASRRRPVLEISNKLNKLTSTTKVGIFSGIDGLSFEMLDEMKKLDFEHWEDLRSTLGVSQTTLDRIKQVLHEHLKEEKEKEKAGSEAGGWLAASSSSSARPPTRLNPRLPLRARRSGRNKTTPSFRNGFKTSTLRAARIRAKNMKRQYKVC